MLNEKGANNKNKFLGGSKYPVKEEQNSINEEKHNR
jgi:hypothetical protein